MSDQRLSIFEDSDRPQAPPSRAAKPRPRRRVGLILLVGVLVLLLIVGAAAAFYAVTLRSAVNNFGTEQVSDYPERPAAAEPNEDGSVAQNYVLIGTDAGSVSPDDPGRSDALLILHVPADRSQLYLISIPRDLYSEIPGYEDQKITHAYAFGGMGLSVQSVERLFDVRVDHAASIDFQSFADLTTALGGVEVDNQTPFQRTAIDGTRCDFPSGTITIDGPCALQFARERKQLPNGDLSRAENHRLIIQAILQKVASPATLANPARFRDVVLTVSEFVTVDEGFDADVITSQAPELGGLASRDMVSLQAPITGFGRDPRTNASIALPDEEKMSELGEALRSDNLADYVAKYPQG